jgi:hypothetical protein
MASMGCPVTAISLTDLDVLPLACFANVCYGEAKDIGGCRLLADLAAWLRLRRQLLCARFQTLLSQPQINENDPKRPFAAAPSWAESDQERAYAFAQTITAAAAENRGGGPTCKCRPRLADMLIPIPLRELWRRQRMADPESLGLVATLASQISQGIFGFNAFPNDFEIQCATERDHRSRDGSACRVAFEAAHERLVNLEFVQRQAGETAQAGITGAEIVQRDLYAKVFELVQCLDRLINVLHDCALGHFYLNAVRVDAIFGHDRSQPLGKIPLAELKR